MEHDELQENIQTFAAEHNVHPDQCRPIPKHQMVLGQEYEGECRNASKATWNGKQFVYKRYKFGFTYNDTINHYEDDDGYDVFVPIEIAIKPDEMNNILYVHVYQLHPVDADVLSDEYDNIFQEASKEYEDYDSWLKGNNKVLLDYVASYKDMVGIIGILNKNRIPYTVHINEELNNIPTTLIAFLKQEHAGVYGDTAKYCNTDIDTMYLPNTPIPDHAEN